MIPLLKSLAKSSKIIQSSAASLSVSFIEICVFVGSCKVGVSESNSARIEALVGTVITFILYNKIFNKGGTIAGPIVRYFLFGLLYTFIIGYFYDLVFWLTGLEGVWCLMVTKTTLFFAFVYPFKKHFVFRYRSPSA